MAEVEIIDVELGTSGVEKGVKSIKNLLSNMGNSVDAYADAVKRAFNDEMRFNSESGQRNGVANRYDEARTKLELLIKEERTLMEQASFLKSNGSEGTPYFESVQNELDKVRDKLKEARAEVKEFKNIMNSSDRKYIGGDSASASDLTADAMGRLGARLKNAFAKPRAEINSFKEDVKSVGTVTQRSLTKSVRSANGSLANLSGLLSSAGKKVGSFFGAFKKGNTTLGGSIKKLLGYALGIGGMMVLFNKIRSVASTTINEMVKKDKELNKSMSDITNSLNYLRGAVGTAIAPIINAVAPTLSMIIDLLAEATDKVAQFMAVLTGASTYTKATKQNKDYAKSLKGVGSAQEKALGAYDKLNVISKNSGGGSSVGYETGAKATKAVSAFAKKVRKIMSDLFKPIKSAWDKYGQPVIDSAKRAFETIKSVVDAIVGTIGAVWNKYGEEITRKLLMAVKSVLDWVSSIGQAFLNAWENGGRPFVESILNALGAIINMWTAISEAFRHAFDSGVGESILTHILAIVTNINNFVAGLADAFTNAWNSAGLGESICQGLLDLMDSIAETTSDITAKVAEWAKNIDFTPVLESMDELIKSLKPALDDLGDALEVVVNDLLLPCLKFLIENTIPSYISDLADSIGFVSKEIKILKPLLSGLWEILKPLFEYMGKEAPKNALLLGTSFAMPIRMVGKMKDAIDVLKGGLPALGEAIKNPVNNFLSGIETLVNGFAKGINIIIDALNGLNIEIPEWSPIGAGSKFGGFNIPKVSEVKIPRLATGAVIPANKEFMAVLGDQKSGTNIETPLSTMVDAFKMALSDMNNGQNIILQLNGREIAKAVWDETDKRYKQTGKYGFA